MMMECSAYQEFDLQSIQGLELPVQNITYNDIVELIVIRQMNTLVTVLIIVISTVIGSFLLYTGGAVIAKVKTEKLLEEERRKVLRITPAPPPPPSSPPQYSQTELQQSSASVAEPRLRNVSVARHT
ncbi:hypothetical protein GCK32_017429 [Trichostrongylus colubriformis]|uniref:Uncharacterized protein n=2 Tax=Trichostrongylus colubriformis TaxID=6319 RepID=A0AAN8FRK1_TRICO